MSSFLTTSNAERCAEGSPLNSARRTESHSCQEAQGTQRGMDIWVERWLALSSSSRVREKSEAKEKKRKLCFLLSPRRPSCPSKSPLEESRVLGNRNELTLEEG